MCTWHETHGGEHSAIYDIMSLQPVRLCQEDCYVYLALPRWCKQRSRMLNVPGASGLYSFMNPDASGSVLCAFPSRIWVGYAQTLPLDIFYKLAASALWVENMNKQPT